MFAALASAAAAIRADELEFMNYSARFNKNFEDVEEFALRLERFTHWHRVITKHNATNGPNFVLGHNQFSDWTDVEYGTILGYVVKTETDENDIRRV